MKRKHVSQEPTLLCAAVPRVTSTENMKTLNLIWVFKAQMLERAPRIFLFSMIHKALLKCLADVICAK